MALQLIQLSDTFNDWRKKTNNVATYFGDLDQLVYPADNVVSAFNLFTSNATADYNEFTANITGQFGNLDNLIIPASNMVSAFNAVAVVAGLTEDGVVSIEAGGTNANTAAQARINLGLGDTANVTFHSLTLDGNITINGNVTQLDVENIVTTDNMIYLNHDAANAMPDLGFAGAYDDGVYQHTGLFRDASDGIYKFYDGYLPEPDASLNIDTSNASFRLSNVAAHLFYGNVSGEHGNFTQINSSNVISSSLIEGVVFMSVGANSLIQGGNVYSTGNITSLGTISAVDFNSASDVNLKDNIIPISNALDLLCQFQGVSYNWKDTGSKGFGFIAQEVEKVLPEIVTTDSSGKKGINYSNLISFLVESVKELRAEIDLLKNK